MGDRYRLQLMRLFEPSIEEKTAATRAEHNKVILQLDNARPHVAKRVKIYLETLKWEVQAHLPYSPDITPVKCVESQADYFEEN